MGMKAPQIGGVTEPTLSKGARAVRGQAGERLRRPNRGVGQEDCAVLVRNAIPSRRRG
jgi:hypothetical protein